MTAARSPALLLDDLVGRGQLVERRDQDTWSWITGGMPASRAGRRGYQLGLGGRRSPERVLVHPVPAALELEDLLAAGGGARDPQGMSVASDPGPGELQLLGARDRLDHPSPRADGGLVEEVVGGALLTWRCTAATISGCPCPGRRARNPGG